MSRIYDEVEKALAIARESGDEALLVRALLARGCVVLYDADSAAPYFSEAADLARELGDWWRLSQILQRQTYAAMFAKGDLKGSVALAREGRDFARKIGDHLTSHQCGISLVCALFYRDGDPSALPLLRSITSEANETHDLLSEMTGLMAESIILSLQGEPGGAQAAISAAVERASEIGSYFESACYSSAGLAAVARGDISAAWEACEKCCRRSRTRTTV